MHPEGCTLYKRVRVRVYVKPRRGNFGHFTRDLGQNYRQVLFVKINGHTSWASMHFVHMGTPMGHPLLKITFYDVTTSLVAPGAHLKLVAPHVGISPARHS